MTQYSVSPEATRDAIVSALGDKVKTVNISLGEVSLVVSAADYHAAAQLLRDSVECRF